MQIIELGSGSRVGFVVAEGGVAVEYSPRHKVHNTRYTLHTEAFPSSPPAEKLVPSRLGPETHPAG